VPVRDQALLLLAALVGGGLNAVVGGGSFIAFPALLVAGVPAVSANATTTFALWPGGVASALAYRRHLEQPRRVLMALGGASLVGGALGARLLLGTPNATFVRLVPWLLLFATVLFTFGGRLATRLGARAADGRFALGAGVAVQLVIATYGGYFGGGMGIMMLAAWSLLGMRDIHAMNGLRSVLATLLNGVAVIAFVAAGAIAWRPGLVMVAGATAAGYLGAATARRIDPRWVRVLVAALAWVLTAWFFVRSAYADRL
jgi:uncharacterized membrane protein YfcA